jgi:hypothetical protein
VDLLPRLAADVGRVVIVVVGDLAFVREVDPVALEDVLHFEFEQRLVGERAAVQAIVAARFVFDEEVVDRGQPGGTVRVNRDHEVSPTLVLCNAQKV